MDINKLNLKPIKNFDGYYISDCGKVVSTKINKNGKVMVTWYGSSGYEDVKLCKNSKTTHRNIHRLVAEAFIPNPNNKPEIHHKDNNPKNNHYTNLEWVSRKENLSHSYNTMPPTRNFKKCELYHNSNGLIKKFNNKKEACKYASENFGCSKTSLMKYLKSGEYKLVLKV